MLKFMWYNFLSQTTVIKSTTLILGKWIKESIAYTSYFPLFVLDFDVDGFEQI